MPDITYGSVCSGIEAATQAWHPLGMRAAWFAEIEPFPSAVLAHHYPDVPNHGDMTKLAALVLAGKETAVSEVKRYHVTETGLVEGESLGRLSVVLAADFDRVTAERDAALAELGRYQSLFNQAQKAIDRLNELHRKRMAEIGRRLTAADERNDNRDSEIFAQVQSALRRSFSLGQIYWQQADSDSTCQQNKSDQTMEVQEQHILNVLKSLGDALKPADSADYRKSCEAAHKALSMENQRIVSPGQFKCLACGDIHPGSWNLPCPKMSPTS